MTQPEPHAANEQGHPSVLTYVAIFAILTVVTVVEVGVFYVPAFKAVLAPVLLVLSTSKFILVAMFYMHLKSDHKLFSLIFIVPLLIAVGVLVALMFLFGQLGGG